MSDSSRGDVVVIGGGIGGLTAALALGRAGRKVRVLEREPEFGTIGYGIQLGPNAFFMFAKLGLSDAVLDASVLPGALVMRDALDGAEVTRIPTGANLRERFGNPYVVLHRVDLHRVLIDACMSGPGVELIPSTRVASYRNLAGRAQVLTVDGDVLEADLVIAADGLGSTVRAQMLGEGAPRFTGYAAHRTILPMALVPDGVPKNDVVLWGGPDCHFIHYPLRAKSVFNMVAVFQTPTYAEPDDAVRHRQEIEKVYRDVHPTIRGLLDLMDVERRWAIADRDPVRVWHDGRVVLLGDAAHPTLQSLAQGASMAIEDAVCLAELIQLHPDDLDKAFQRYEEARVLRTARVQLESRNLWPFFLHAPETGAHDDRGPRLGHVVGLEEPPAAREATALELDIRPQGDLRLLVLGGVPAW